MKAEKCVEMLNYIIANMTAEEKQEMENYIKVFGKEQGTAYNNHSFNRTVPTAIAEMLRVCTLEMTKDNDKTNGKSKQAAVIKSVIKGINNAYPKVSYIVNGKHYVCNGYQLFEFNEICQSVPIGTEKDMASTKPDPQEWYEKFINQAENNKYIELEVPDRTKLSMYIKTKKAKWKTVGNKAKDLKLIEYNFGEGLPAINAEYLLDLIDGIPDGKLYCTNGGRSIYVSPLVMLGSNNRAITMPIRKDPNKTDIKTEL